MSGHSDQDKILFVDDEAQARKYFQKAYGRDFDVVTAAGAADADRVLETQGEAIGVIVTDQRMPGENGVSLLQRVHQHYPWIVRILTTAYSDIDSAIDAVNTGAVFRYVTKPWDIHELRGILLRAMEMHQLQREHDALLRERPNLPLPPLQANRPRGQADSAQKGEQWESGAENKLTIVEEPEQVLANQPAFMHLITSSVEEGLCAFDANGKIIFSNPSAQRMLGWRELELLGRNLHEAIHRQQHYEDADKSPQQHAVACVLHAGESIRRHCDTFARQDGSTFPVSYTAAPIIESGRITGGVLAFHDITELTRTQEQLRSLNETLEQRVAERTAEAEARAGQLQVMAAELTQAEQRERHRLAKMLHDHIQQLLVGVKMRLTTMPTADNPAMTEAVAEAKELLTQTIEASRSLSTEIAPPALYDLGLNAALEWLARWAGQRYHLHVELEINEATEISNESLRVMVFDAVRELVVNVVKHADVDEARIRVEADEGTMCVTVEDFGQGFDPASIQQNKASTGHGLLSLEQRLELMGGQVRLDSAPGEGTRIQINVPLDQQKESDHELAEKQGPAIAMPEAKIGLSVPSNAPAGKDIRVMLADDHQVVRQGVANLIDQQAQMRVVGEATTGEEAVQIAGQLHPDVVVMDISLPGISGIEATRQIKQQLPRTQVIGLSMHEERDVADGLRAAGAAGFVSKAEPAEDLVAVIHQLLSTLREQGDNLNASEG